MDGDISFSDCVGAEVSDNPGCEIIEATTTPTGTDLYGQISYGRLTIRGSVAKAFLYKNNETFLRVKVPQLGVGQGNFILSRTLKRLHNDTPFSWTALERGCVCET
jgi:hypothetical protein